MSLEDASAQADTIERLLDTQDKGLILAGCPLFRGIPRSSLEVIARASDVTTAYKGQTLMEEGEAAREILQVVHGRVDLRVESISPNMEVSIVKLSTGEMIGETAVLGEGHWHVTALATEPSVLLRVGADVVRRLCDESPETGRAIYRNAAAILAGRLRRTNQRLVTFMRRISF